MDYILCEGCACELTEETALPVRDPEELQPVLFVCIQCNAKDELYNSETIHDNI